MRAGLGPGRNEGHGAGWMSVDSGQVRAAVGCLGKSFREMGVREAERCRRLGWGLDEEFERKEAHIKLWRYNMEKGRKINHIKHTPEKCMKQRGSRLMGTGTCW